jgi:hypothetical protein
MPFLQGDEVPSLTPSRFQCIVDIWIQIALTLFFKALFHLILTNTLTGLKRLIENTSSDLAIPIVTALDSCTIIFEFPWLSQLSFEQ